MADLAPFDPERLVKVLAKHRVRFVLIGALAARLQGFPRLTADAEITPARDRDNISRLAAALRELHARVFTEALPEGLAFDCSAQTLSRAETWNLVTAAGRLDIAFFPSGTAGYDDLVQGALRFEVYGRIARRIAAGHYPLKRGGRPATGSSRHLDPARHATARRPCARTPRAQVEMMASAKRPPSCDHGLHDIPLCEIQKGSSHRDHCHRSAEGPHATGCRLFGEG